MSYCRKCGSPLGVDDAFCHACGDRVVQEAAPPPPPPPPHPAPVAAPYSKPPSSGGKTLWYVISGVLVVALIAFGALYMQTSGKLNTANTKITGLQSNVSDLQGNVASLTTQLNAEKAKSADLTTQLTAAQASVTKLTADLAAANASLTTAQGQIKTIQANLDTATASVTKLTADLATANAKVTTTQASLDKATADLTKATADLATANASLTKANADLASMTTNFNNANTNYKKVADPRHFNSPIELTSWLAKDDTNTNPAYKNYPGPDLAYVLQVKALRDGYLVSTFLFVDSTGAYYTSEAIAGGMIYLIDPATDETELVDIYLTPSHPLPLP